MSIGEATGVISLVIVVAQSLGAVLNDRRFNKILQDLGPIRERLARVETKLGLGPWNNQGD